MLFATYGAPSPPRGKNPLLIVLGVCGGCVLLVIIGVVVMAVLGVNMFKGIATGAVEMTKTMPAFLADLKAHDYNGCESLVDPSAKSTLTASKIRSMEEGVEKKLGKLKSYPTRPSDQGTKQISSPGDPSARASIVEYIYTYPLTYEKGSATATFKFMFDASGARNGDFSKMKMSGKVTDFTLKPGSQ